MKNGIKLIFASLEPSYLVRQYFFGAATFAYLVYSWFFNIATPFSVEKALFLAILIVDLILYPFSMFVYDSIMGLILGDNIFAFGGILFLVSLFWKLAKMIFMFLFAFLIAPFGILFLYLKNRRFQEVRDYD